MQFAETFYHAVFVFLSQGSFTRHQAIRPVFLFHNFDFGVNNQIQKYLNLKLSKQSATLRHNFFYQEGLAATTALPGLVPSSLT
jgi:hypothetical protein